MGALVSWLRAGFWCKVCMSFGDLLQCMSACGKLRQRVATGMTCNQLADVLKPNICHFCDIFTYYTCLSFVSIVKNIPGSLQKSGSSSALSFHVLSFPSRLSAAPADHCTFRKQKEIAGSKYGELGR